LVFKKLKKIQAVFELWPETPGKMAIFGPQKPLNLAYLGDFWSYTAANNFKFGL